MNSNMVVAVVPVLSNCHENSRTMRKKRPHVRADNRSSVETRGYYFDGLIDQVKDS